MQIPGNDAGEIALVDIDEERLKTMHAVVQKRAEVPIERGDNKGKTLTYTNIVREMLPVGTWSGQAMSLQLARTAVMRPETEAAIVLLQEGKAGPIIGAAWTGLW
jgi:hypothetical protein